MFKDKIAFRDFIHSFPTRQELFLMMASIFYTAEHRAYSVKKKTCEKEPKNKENLTCISNYRHKSEDNIFIY
jgi:hypothetical protein